MNLRKVKKFAFMLAIATGFAGTPSLSSLSVVQAQHQQPYQERERGYREERRMIMDEEGFRDGFRSGVRDARRGERFSPWSHRRYEMGDRYYRRDFRRGYERGFRRVYDRY
jgi:hypothetical protein